MFGYNLQSALIAGKRFGRVAARFHKHAKIKRGIRILGIGLKCGLIRVASLIDALESSQNVAQIVEGFGVCRINCDRRL
ncbi:hypothetical protein MnTg02_00230 [bacterium MnTg02]|nr:hypothetical protein MnTg02_00230 [bacterium MnTg02]